MIIEILTDIMEMLLAFVPGILWSYLNHKEKKNEKMHL